MAEDEKKSLLQQVMEPFIMGAQHTASAVGGDLQDKGLLGTLWSGANQFIAGAPHIFQPKIPTYALANPEASQVPWLAGRLGLDPNAIKQVGYKGMGEIFGEQAGGPVAEAINRIIKSGEMGKLPKNEIFDPNKVVRYYTGATRGNRGWHVTPISVDELGNEFAGKPVDILGTKKAANALKDKLMEDLLKPR